MNKTTAARQWCILLCRAIYPTCLLIAFTASVSAQQLKVLKQGLGFGSVNASAPVTLNCGATCDANVSNGTAVVLTANPATGSRFVSWAGTYPAGAIITGNVIRFTMPATTVTVRPTFAPDLPSGLADIPELRNDQLNPDSIAAYLIAHPYVNTPARFVKALPAEYRRNWIPMTRSESLQTGTAKYPRLLLPSGDGRNVFSLGLAEHPSFPSSSPNAIEYMQWDATNKNFRFHEIVLANIAPMGKAAARSRGVTIDDAKCFNCHSTQNVLNRSTHAGTTGIPPRTLPNEVVKSKSKPNWDAYDSWAGMLPFNRDRIYQGTLEERAFRKLFNLWNWRATALNDSIRQVLEQLDLQPPGIDAIDGITRQPDETTDTRHLTMAFGRTDDAVTGTTTYNFGNPAAAPYSVFQGGKFLVMQHTVSPLDDEGRGVLLFDQLGGLRTNLNKTRIADELINHRFATGSHPIDVRPLALAIANGLITIQMNQAASTVAGQPLRNVRAFFDARNGMGLADLLNDTRNRAKSLPRRKADLQRANIDRTFPDGAVRQRDPYLIADEKGLYQEYDAPGTVPIDSVRRLIFKRSPQSFNTADAINGGVYVDRELYDASASLVENINTKPVTLFRYFLEPLGVSVSTWTIGVRARAFTYAFADVFNPYLSEIRSEMSRSMLATPPAMPAGFTGPFNPNNSTHVMMAVNQSLAALPAADETPRFTDVQRIFNKACNSCHGGLAYPPYTENFGNIDFSEQEEPISFSPPIPNMIGGYTPDISRRLWRSFYYASSYASSINDLLFRKISDNEGGTPYGENHPNSLMPSGGPKLSQTDIETIRRWITGTPANPFTVGDPHLKTVEGVSYDFQADGEFTMLRGDFFELQVRQKAIATNSQLGPDDYHKLTSCVSINTAAALWVAGHRITFQPDQDSKQENPTMVLRVDGQPVSLSSLPLAFAPSSRIVRSIADGGIQVEGVGGTVVVMTPMFWNHYRVWYLNVDVRKSRADRGVMGMIKPGNWLPALPDGTQPGPMPGDLNARFKYLYGVFAEAWRVSNKSSLFDYAPGTNTATFTNRNWPATGTGVCQPPASATPQKPFTLAQAEELAADIKDPLLKKLCIQDLMATGEASFAKAYRFTDIISGNKYPLYPVLTYPANYAKVAPGTVSLIWNKAIDEDGDPITYRVALWEVNTFPDSNKAENIPDPGGVFGQNVWKCHLLVLILLLVLLFILYRWLGKKHARVFYLLAVLLTLLAFVLIRYVCKDTSPTITHSVHNLQAGKRYFWKVIAEDDKGGVTESETYRIDVE